jgi:hypothetical protein
MIDERVRDHLHAGAAGLDLPSGDVHAVLGRASRRRRFRRAGGSIVLAAVVATSGVVVLGGGRSGESVLADGGAAVTESSYDWHVVETERGLTSATPPVVTDDGTSFSISTPPASAEGPADDDGTNVVVYRSADGRNWEPTALPEDLLAGSLASDGDVLYAMGTAPEGDGGDVLALARTDDAGATWTVTRLPIGLEDLRARHPGMLEVEAGSMSIVRGPAGLVGMVTVRLGVDPADVVPGGVDGSEGARFTDRGVEVESWPDGDGAPPVTRSLTWDEVDLAPELRRFAGRRTLLTFTVDDAGGASDVVEVPVPVPEEVPEPVFLADESRYVLAVNQFAHGRAGVAVRTSTDGRTWGPAESPFQEHGAGYLLGSGLLDGRSALVGLTESGATLAVAEAGGWRIGEPLNTMVGDDGAPVQLGFGEFAFGPLGVAALVWSADEQQPPQAWVVHSTDGRSLTAIDLTDHVDHLERYHSVDLDVTADAIIVRKWREDHESGEVSPVQLVVGTPPA